MARTARDMADQLIEIYSDQRKKYSLSKDGFKAIAGKEMLRDAYFGDVDSNLREDGYLLVDLRNEKDAIAVLKIKTVMKWNQLPQDTIHEYEFEDWEEE